jgi:hypothetical protein
MQTPSVVRERFFLRGRSHIFHSKTKKKTQVQKHNKVFFCDFLMEKSTYSNKWLHNEGECLFFLCPNFFCIVYAFFVLFFNIKHG